MSELRTKVWVGLFILVVFLVGLGVGAVAVPWLEGGPRLERTTGPGGPRGIRRRPMDERILERLSGTLDLTDAQAERLQGVFEARRTRFRAISREMRERFDREREGFRVAIGDILTPEQMERFEAELVRMDNERRRRRVHEGR